MTICLAALCVHDGAPRAVVAADRMVTYPGFIEFEHAVPKMAHATPFAVVMVAGDALIGTRLARDTAAALFATSPPLGEVAQRLAQNYESVRHQRLESQILSPRGLSLQSFYGAHQSLNPQITMLIDQAMNNYNLGVELLLAGVDPTGAHIHSIHNPGKADLQHDVIGYAAIGSGAIHAIQSMIGFRHSPGAGFKEAVFRVYASKRRAEVAPGVGVDIDMAVISGSGVRHLSDEELESLRVLYNEFQEKTNEVLQGKLANLTIEEPPENDGANGEAGGDNDAEGHA
jgi:hypothetical protein